MSRNARPPMARRNILSARGKRIRNVIVAAGLTALSSGHRLPYTAAELARMPEKQIVRIHPEKIIDTLARSKPAERAMLLQHLPVAQLARLPRNELKQAPTKSVVAVLNTRPRNEQAWVPTELIALLASARNTRASPSAKLVEVEQRFLEAAQEAGRKDIEYWSGGSLGTGMNGLQKLGNLDRIATLIYFVKNGKLLIANGIAQTNLMRREVAEDVHFFAVFEKQATSEQLSQLAEGKISASRLEKEISGN